MRLNHCLHAGHEPDTFSMGDVGELGDSSGGEACNSMRRRVFAPLVDGSML